MRVCIIFEGMTKDWKYDFTLIRKIINDWDPIGGTPENEYDDLVFGIQSRLLKKVDSMEIIEYIFHYITQHVGIDVSIEEVQAIFGEIEKTFRNAH